MESLAETLWQEFANETEEHLEILEPLLSRSGSVGGEEIAQIFRSFHSLKGLSRAMDLLGMEAVAHRAENLLGLVRDGRVPLDESLAGLLLRSIDNLKQMRDAVVASRKDSAADARLIAELEQVFVVLGGSGDAPPPPPPDTPAEPAPTTGESAPSHGDGSLHEDSEMLELFIEVMKTRLPELALLLTPSLADPKVHEDTLDSVQSLAHASEVMGFEQLAGNLRQLESAIPPGRALAEAERRDIIQLLGMIRLQAELITEVTGGDAGAGDLVSALLDLLGDDVAALVQELINTLGQLEIGFEEDGAAALAADAGELSLLARAANAALLCLGYGRSSQLLLLIEDVYSRIAQGDMLPTPALLEASRAILEGIDPRRLLAAGLKRTDIGEEVEADLVRRFRSVLQSLDGEAAPQDSGTGRNIGRFFIKPELLEILSPENLQELKEASDAGDRFLFEVLLHFEASPETATKLVDWLARDARPVTNRTVLKDSESWFEFLVLSRLNADDMRATLLQLDPAQQCVRGLRQIGDGPAGTVALGHVTVAVEPPMPLPASVVEAPQAGGADKAPRAAATVLRVRSETIDRFMTQIGEMRIAATELSVMAEDQRMQSAIAALRRLGDRLEGEDSALLNDCVHQLEEHHRLVRQFDQQLDSALGRLHASALDLRVVPVDAIFNRFPRVVRDLAQAQGKDIQLVLEGRDVRVDKSMVDLLVDPLMHMVRNSVDHGIELPEPRMQAGKPAQATVQLRAVQRGNEVLVEVIDDGRGLNAEAIRAKAVARNLVSEAESRRMSPEEIHRFIFKPGFSTAEQVTETSGRGVGMDVVLTSVNRLGGDIEIRTVPGHGSTFVLHLPLSAALQNSLLVEVEGQHLAIPERHVAGVEEVVVEQVQRVGDQRAILHRNAFLPIYHLGALLGMSDGIPACDAFPIVVVSNGHSAIGLQVDRLRRRQELFLKDLHPKLSAFPAIGGASVLGDGKVVLILDADGLIQLAKKSVRRGGAPARPREAAVRRAVEPV